ncbi:hypothetical protein [Streptomyces sp. enrichment culture]|uniref:hypothetical protein n=1 Tax=Streptomyces sp. enrichment culture TaxID=1795815 RepID=UPI003F5664D2
MVPLPLLSAKTFQDHVALAEIELCGELMIAASTADGERLSADRIDEVLKVSSGTQSSYVPEPRPAPGTWTPRA